MDEQARKERLEMMMARKIALEEYQEVVRVDMETKKRAFLEEAAVRRKLRRAEMAEMHRLRQDNMEIARKIRKAQIQEHREQFANFCERAAEFLQREEEFLRKKEKFMQMREEFLQRENRAEETKPQIRVYEVLDITIEPKLTEKDTQHTDR